MNTITRTQQIEAARAADTQIAAAWDIFWDAQAPVTAAYAAIKQAQKMRRYSGGTTDERIAKINEKLIGLEATAAAARLAAVELDAELYTGWSRFFRVEHIHSSQNCSSFRPTTRIGWLPTVSGLTEAEAVAAHGAILCTICFPSAPVEHTSGKQDDRCSGSGKTIYNDLPKRTGFYSGNSATCADCGKTVGISSKGMNIPKHVAA